MGDVRVRKLADEVVAQLKARAKRNGHSLEAELRGILTVEAFRPYEEWTEKLANLRQELRNEYGKFSDSTAIIREERDRLG